MKIGRICSIFNSYAIANGSFIVKNLNCVKWIEYVLQRSHKSLRRKVPTLYPEPALNRSPRVSIEISLPNLELPKNLRFPNEFTETPTILPLLGTHNNCPLLFSLPYNHSDFSEPEFAGLQSKADVKMVILFSSVLAL